MSDVTLRTIIDHAYATRWCHQKDGERSRQRALDTIPLEVARPTSRPCDMTRAHLEGEVAGMRAEGLAPATINRHLAALSCAFKVAYDDGLIDHPGPRFPRLPEGDGRERVPTRDEVAAILRALRRDYYGMSRCVRLMYRTGIRKGEALNLRWEDVWFSDGDLMGGVYLELSDTKNGTDRRVPVPEACSAYLGRLARRRGSDIRSIFPIPPSTFSHLWRSARDRAGLGDWFVPHSLRHARATELVRAGTPVAYVARILGHRDWSTTQRYTHATEADLRQAIERRSH